MEHWLSPSYKGELYNMNEELDDTYKVVFRQCYPKLLFYATRLVGTEEAEDVVQDVLWSCGGGEIQSS